jgi:hypothetical protein
MSDVLDDEYKLAERTCRCVEISVRMCQHWLEPKERNELLYEAHL